MLVLPLWKAGLPASFLSISDCIVVNYKWTVTHSAHSKCLMAWRYVILTCSVSGSHWRDKIYFCSSSSHVGQSLSGLNEGYRVFVVVRVLRESFMRDITDECLLRKKSPLRMIYQLVYVVIKKYLPRHSYLSWSHLSKWIWMQRCQWYAVAWQTTGVTALLAENNCSFPSPSSMPAPSFRPIWKQSWQSRLCTAPWKEPVQHWKLKLWTSSPIPNFDSVAENVQPISYANKISCPNVWISFLVAATGYFALFTNWEGGGGIMK